MRCSAYSDIRDGNNIILGKADHDNCTSDDDKNENNSNREDGPTYLQVRPHNVLPRLGYSRKLQFCSNT